MRKIIIVTSEGESREDGNVFYSDYLLVESPTLKFDEPIFEQFDDVGRDPFRLLRQRVIPMTEVVRELVDLGYTVEECERDFIIATS